MHIFYAVGGPKLKKKCPYCGRGTPSPRSDAMLPRTVAIILGFFLLKCWEVWKKQPKADLHSVYKFDIYRHIKINNQKK